MERILFAAAEGLPFIKTGGLADVVASLPVSLCDQGCEVAVVLPMYKKIQENLNEAVKQLGCFEVCSGVLKKTVELFYSQVQNVSYYFIKQDDFYGRDELYGYQDDDARFSFYCQAVIEMLHYIDFKPTVLHSHDWHTGMIAALCKTDSDEKIQNIKQVFTIHNLAFQGNFPIESLQYLNINERYFEDGTLRFDSGISFMKAGILFADKITTVSSSYVQEIMTPQFGQRMQDVLKMRQNDLSGIVNGIDTIQWDPQKDALISKNYGFDTIQNKLHNKRAIQKEFGLRVADDVLLLGVVSRLTWQKGVSILLEKLSVIMNQDVQLIVLGSGESGAEQQFGRLEYIYPRRAAFYCGYDEKLSHRVYAGIDALLMPSLFEPCGISQLIAMRYGVLPFVRETGGLKDTVQPYNEFSKEGNGFSFTHYNGDDMFHVLSYMISIYYDHPDDWKMIQNQAMNTVVDWNQSAALYIKVYSEITKSEHQLCVG